ncbi:MAG: FxLYD domain-containing protein [Miniphocaeibacter sp.]|uniref:FxLYD domain-containing protein n=1 Tax=Miniphocaeibacter sp. TaxID=3100973 RepID=UPI003BB18221
MKKKVIVIIGLLFLTLLAGCSSNNVKDSTKINYADKEFLSSFKKGLEKRWDLPEIDLTMDIQEQKEEYLKAIDIELNEIKGYSSEKFEDTKLQEKALSYINILKEQRESLDYFTVDEIKFYETWDKISAERSKILVDLVDSYKIEFSEKYKNILDDFKLNAQMAIEDDTKNKEIEDIVNKVEFTKVKEEYGSSYYEAVVENTSSVEFEHFSLEISLIDEEGIIVESTYSNNISNWKPGQKFKFEFVTQTTFAKMEFEPQYFIKE